MWCAGRPHQHILLLLLHMIVPIQNLFVVFLRYEFIHYFFTPACGYDHEHVPCRGAEILCEFIDLWYLFLIPFCKGGVNKKLDAMLLKKLRRIDGSSKSARFIPEVIMHGVC